MEERRIRLSRVEAKEVDDWAKSVVEAALFAAGRALSLKEISDHTDLSTKVAKLVAMFMNESDLHFSGVPDVFYAQRVQALVDNGLLEAQGNLKFMRYSEVRKPTNT